MEYWYVYMNACHPVTGCYTDLQAFNTKAEAMKFVEKEAKDLNLDRRFFRVIHGREYEIPHGTSQDG